MNINRITETKFVDGITGEILSVLTIVADRYVIEGFDAETNSIVLVSEKDHLKYIALSYRKEISLDDFLSKCDIDICHKDWVEIFFSGMKRVYPEVWEAIPDDEIFSITEVCALLKMCGVVFD